MLLCEDFLKFDVQTNQKCSRDNGKVATFMHYPSCSLHLFFPSYLDQYLTSKQLCWTLPSEVEVVTDN